MTFQRCTRVIIKSKGVYFNFDLYVTSSFFTFSSFCLKMFLSNVLSQYFINEIGASNLPLHNYLLQGNLSRAVVCGVIFL